MGIPCAALPMRPFDVVGCRRWGLRPPCAMQAGNVLQALEVMVKASVFSKADAGTLQAFLQSQQQEEDAGAPSAAAYESKSGGIVSVLEATCRDPRLRLPNGASHGAGLKFRQSLGRQASV